MELEKAGSSLVSYYGRHPPLSLKEALYLLEISFMEQYFLKPGGTVIRFFVDIGPVPVQHFKYSGGLSLFGSLIPDGVHVARVRSGAAFGLIQSWSSNSSKLD